jgi:ribosome-binding ATPase YchF (GTP1/OBG family)
LTIRDVLPFFTMRSDIILSFTFPSTGTWPHATGAVHSAAAYENFPLTVGR